ncbi:hypothetical protein [Bacillus mesophilum]|uniref:hypothetical protein n=1 Tax=Bacillus mesophilum TaxID=1071718 RepID=UPI001375AB26|nr:hypothetical protein [Bacillus mesophilum]
MKKISCLAEAFIEDENDDQGKIINFLNKGLQKMFQTFLLIGIPVVGYSILQLFI